jgi:hypothetical protein
MLGWVGGGGGRSEKGILPLGKICRSMIVAAKPEITAKGGILASLHTSS